MYLTRRFKFDSAHRIIGYIGKCQRLHGHEWNVDITVCGEVGEDGMIVDFKKLKEVINNSIIKKLDHEYLNDILPFNPTAENIVKWIFNESQKALKDNGIEVKVYSIKLWENYPECCVEHRGDFKLC